MLLEWLSAEWLTDDVQRMRTTRLESRHLRCHILGIGDRSAGTLMWPQLTLPCGRLKGLSQEIGIHEEKPVHVCKSWTGLLNVVAAVLESLLFEEFLSESRLTAMD